jgi:hypothetical protein
MKFNDIYEVLPPLIVIFVCFFYSQLKIFPQLFYRSIIHRPPEKFHSPLEGRGSHIGKTQTKRNSNSSCLVTLYS